MQIDLTQIILAFITLLGTILTGLIIPLIKKRIEVESGKLTETQAALLKLAISTAVKAAEQLFSSEACEEKKNYVLDILRQQGYEVDGDAVNAAIEAAVLELHKQLK